MSLSLTLRLAILHLAAFTAVAAAGLALMGRTSELRWVGAGVVVAVLVLAAGYLAFVTAGRIESGGRGEHAQTTFEVVGDVPEAREEGTPARAR